MSLNGLTKALLILVLGTFALVGGQNVFCPTIEVLDPFYVNSTIDCNEQGTLLFFVYEDCPTDYVLFNYGDELTLGEDCQDIIYEEETNFGFTEVGDAEEPSTNTKVCPRFFQNVSDPDGNGYSALFTFIDVNEYPPEPHGDLDLVMSIYVDENTMGTILSFSYRDPDEGEADTLTCSYDFEGDASDIFSIIPGDVDDDVMYFTLEAKELLDFETNNFFSLEATFQSQDSRGNSSNTTQSFLVFVQDVGDNPPFFTTIVPFADIPEGGPDVFVYQVLAQDRDVSINNPIFYSFRSGNDEGYFRINSSTGEVFTNKTIDREALESPLFTLEVEATEVLDDQGTPAPDQNSTTQVTNVNIEDLNDNTPTFDNESYATTLDEFDEVNPTSSMSLDVIIVVTDMDEGISGEYSIQTDNENVRLNPTSGSGSTTVTVTITNSDDFDYEAQAANPSIEVEITATEEANSTHSSSTTLVITLNDINDKVPTFLEVEYVTNVNETLSVGSSVLTVEATDADASPEFHDNLVYDMTGCDDLTINATTGVIYLTTPLDFEDKTTLECTLVVSDMNGTSADALSSEAPLTVNVQDVNDEFPAFVNFVDNVNVVEGTEPTTEISVVEVSDPDTSASLAVTLEFANDPGEEVESWFELQENDTSTESHYVGIIVIKNSPDREVSDEVVVIVRAVDSNAQGGDQETTKSLTIAIEDINDVTPAFAEDYSDLDYDENSPSGTTVLVVQAEDPDLDDELTFELVDDLGYLQINPINGSVTVLQEVDRETTAYFDVTLIVRDLVNHTNSVQIAVTVNDLNDNSPELDQDICSDSYEISEDDDDGTFLTTVTASDNDEDIHAQIVFVIKNPNSIGYEYQYAPFDIDSVTGAITVNSSGDRINDREQYPEWQLIIDAFDQCDPVEAYCQVQSDECVMSVTVLDINDNPPDNYKLNEGTEILTDETLMEGDSIEGLEISALDPDEPNSVNSKITFEVAAMWQTDGSLIEALFQAVTRSRLGAGDIEEFYCNLEAATNLTGLRGDYTIQIQGSDSGSPVYSSTANFSMTIADANDMIPVFNYSECLLENDLTITMTENITEVGVPLSCSSDDVIDRLADIYVTDDDAPQTPNSEVSLEIDYETSSVVEGGTDNQLEAFVIYKGYSEEGRYAIAISEKIDRERGSKYNLSLVAQDHGDEPQVEYSSILIVVKDLSEFPPTFCEAAPCQQTLWIKENTNATTSFLEAEDEDNSLGEENDIIYYTIIDSDVDAFIIPVATVPQLRPKIPLDREAQGTYQMTIMASNSATGSPPAGIEDTDRVLQILVVIVDENDETPFYDDVIYGDFLDTGLKGDQVALLEFIDLDLNDTITYTFGSAFEWSGGQNYTDPFTIEVLDDRRSRILLNMDPDGKSGYCTFTINAEDEVSHSSSAVTQVFVVTKEYIVPFYFLNNIEDVEDNKDNIEEIFTNVFNFTCIIDGIDEVVDSNNVAIPGQTVVSAHFIREVENESEVTREIGFLSSKHDEQTSEFGTQRGRPDIQMGEAKEYPKNKHHSKAASNEVAVNTLFKQPGNSFIRGNRFKNSLDNPTETLSSEKEKVQEIKTSTQNQFEQRRFRDESRGIGSRNSEVQYELVPETEIEELGSKGQVASELTSELNVLGLNLVRIGETETGIVNDYQQTINNLKIALGVVTLILGLCVILLILLFIVRTSKLRRELKAMSTNVYSSKSSGLNKTGVEFEQIPGSNRYAQQGTNPIFNLNEEKVRDAAKDTQSISSWDSVLVGVEENPEFQAYLQKRADLGAASFSDSSVVDSTLPSTHAPFPPPNPLLNAEKVNPLHEDSASTSTSVALSHPRASIGSENSMDFQLNSQFTFK